MDSESDVVMLLAAFRNLASAKDVKCRALCATALPKVLRGATPRRSASVACTLILVPTKWRYLVVRLMVLITAIRSWSSRL